MEKTEFEAELRRDGFRPVFASLQPNMKETNDRHDFDARLFVLGGGSPSHATTSRRHSAPDNAVRCPPAACIPSRLVPTVWLICPAAANGGSLTREAFESDLRREGFEVIHGGQKPNFVEEMHAHSDSMCASWS